MHHLNSHFSLYLEIEEIVHGDQGFAEKLRQCAGLFSQREDIPGNWPRLVYVVGGFWNQVFGEMPEQTIFSNSIFFLILLFSVYGIGKITGGPGTGVLAAALVSLYPNLVGLSRFYGLDFPLTAMVTAGVYALIKTDCWKSRKWSVVFAVISGLGILTKGQYVFFLCGPVLYVTWQSFRRDVHLEPCSAGDESRPGITRIVPLLLNLTIIGLIILTITYFWWCDHISILYNDLVYHFGASYLPEGTVRPFASPPPFRVFTATWLAFYFFQTVFSISPVFFLLFVVNSGCCCSEKGMLIKLLFSGSGWSVPTSSSPSFRQKSGAIFSPPCPQSRSCQLWVFSTTQTGSSDWLSARFWFSESGKPSSSRSFTETACIRSSTLTP